MSNNQTKINLLKETGAIFASALETDKVNFSNYQTAQIVLVTNAPIDEDEEAITAETLLTVSVPNGSTNIPIPFVLEDKDGNVEEVEATGKTIVIGNDAFYVIKVNARSLGKIELEDIVIKTTAVANCTINGTIIAVFSDSRYSE